MIYRASSDFRHDHRVLPEDIRVRAGNQFAFMHKYET
jgi:hypothetical protein